MYSVKQMYSSPNGNAGVCDLICLVNTLEEAQVFWKDFCERNSTQEFFDEEGYNCFYIEDDEGRIEDNYDTGFFEEEEEDESMECCGKHCDETNGLILGLGLYRYHSSVADMITEQLWCEDCYTWNTGHECKGCNEYHSYTEMTYKEGGGFGEALYYYDQYFCKECVDDINSIDYNPDEYKSTIQLK